MTIPEMILKELKIKPLTIYELSQILKKDEATIRTTINRLKERELIEETGLFENKYKIYRLTEVALSSSLILKMLMKLEGIQAVILGSFRGVLIGSIFSSEEVEKSFIEYSLLSGFIQAINTFSTELGTGDTQLHFIQGNKGKILMIGCGPDLTITMLFNDSVSAEEIFSNHLKIINFLRMEFTELPII
ncbi:MAG: roadblock/LC7 domain-containing protein [Promethearchaeota archaeon]|jgi:predicted regulator of Ras-like GTPase activity (Roadblock/LC7/MglB family)